MGGEGAQFVPEIRGGFPGMSRMPSDGGPDPGEASGQFHRTPTRQQIRAHADHLSHPGRLHPFDHGGEVIDTAGEEPVFTSVISLGELAFGVESCPYPAERALRAASLRQIESRPTLAITRHSAAAFGVLAAAVKQAGR